MNRPITFINQYIKGKILTYHIQHEGSIYYEEKMNSYANRPIMDLIETNHFISERILSSEPFMVCRFGATELATIKTFDFELKNRYKDQLKRIHTLSGVFPETDDVGMKFKDLMIESIPEADMIGIWPQAFEEYYIKKYGNNDLKCTWIGNLEPWCCLNEPWTSALRGKKVLVVHPFADSIVSQYKRHHEIFPGTEVLPDFSLDVLKSVQTSGGDSDKRFEDWFEAYEWQLNEINKRDFDIAILGCGAYGFPLAAEIKRTGRQAIHFGGVTQILFGIIGSRWDNDEVVQSLKNDSWVRPMDSEKPKDAEKVENACYW